jgi:hypothetical protein
MGAWSGVTTVVSLLEPYPPHGREAELDLHLVTPYGAHIWYGDRVAPNGAALDVDVTTGYGPEIFSMPSPIKGQYLIYVNYFGGGYHSDDDSQEDAVQPLTCAGDGDYRGRDAEREDGNGAGADAGTRGVDLGQGV